MLFLLKLCGYVASKLATSDEGTVKDRLCLGILFVSQVFAEVASRNKGFGEFGSVGSLHSKVQDYFLDILWDAIKGRMSDLSSALAAYHPGITAETIHPYMMKTAYPNIFSFPHLTFQSLRHDFVFPFTHCITDDSLQSLRVWLRHPAAFPRDSWKLLPQTKMMRHI